MRNPRIHVPESPEPETYDTDLIEQDAIIEEAVTHIRRLTHHLMAALEHTTLPEDAIHKAETICHLAARFTDQFDDAADLISSVRQ